MAKKITYYNFLAPSAMSFKVLHRGRDFFVRFSMPYFGASRYMTTDKELADKITKHKWFRKGLITLEVEVVEENQPSASSVCPVAPPPAKPLFSLGKMKMSGQMPGMSKNTPPPVDEEEESKASTTTDDNTGSLEETVSRVSAPLEESGETGLEAITLDSVSSFLEAKEYLSTVHGIDTTAIKSKLQLAEVASQLGIEFPNYSFS